MGNHERDNLRGELLHVEPWVGNTFNDVVTEWAMRGIEAIEARHAAEVIMDKIDAGMSGDDAHWAYTAEAFRAKQFGAAA